MRWYNLQYNLGRANANDIFYHNLEKKRSMDSDMERQNIVFGTGTTNVSNLENFI